jgi:dihydroorotate dehydrogenase electron transfer subunit
MENSLPSRFRDPEREYRILTRRQLTADVWELRLRPDRPLEEAPGPGQFVNVSVPGLYLRRPISVCDGDRDALTLVFRAVGRGTEAMSRLEPGNTLDILTGLGNGFDTARTGPRPLLLGGGLGAAPLYLLAKRLLEEGKEPAVVLGFNRAAEAFYEREFTLLGCRVVLCTADGSRGVRGFVTDAIPDGYTHVCACGPLPMLRAADAAVTTDGQFSFEERMGCGFGACMGCTRRMKSGPKRVCRDGPVFGREELAWDD